MNILKQSTAATIKIGPFVDDTDGKTAETALTIGQADIRLSKNGGDIAQSHNTAGATHDELGYYNVPLDVTDTNTLGRLLVAVHESGALPVWKEFLVVTANVFDTFCSTGSLNVNAASLSTDAITAASVKADAVTKIQNGLATSAALDAVDNFVDTEVAAILAAVDTEVAAIKAKTDNLPASPAAVGSTMTLTAAYDKAKDDVLTPLAVVDSIVDGLKTTLDNIHDTDLPAVKTDTAAIKAKTNLIPATPASAGEYTAAIAAIPTAPLLAANYTAPDNASIATIKAKTNLIPANPAVADEYDAALAAIQADLDNPAQYKADVSELATAAAVSAIPTTPLLAANYTAPDNTSIAAIKAKTDNLPASPAAVGSAMTLTAAYDKAKDDVLTPLAVVDGVVDAIKIQTDKIPASPASAGEYTTNIGAIKAKTDNLPASPASAGEYTSALTAIQNDLDNPAQYKADISGLATSAELAQTEADIIAAMPDETVIPDGIALETSVQAIKAKTDNLPANPAPANEYDTELAALQADLDNPDQYKSDISGLATKTDVSELATKDDLNSLATKIDLQEVEDKIDAIDTLAVMNAPIDGTYTFEQVIQIMAASLAGKLTRSGNTLTFRDLADTLNRIQAETDENKQRTGMTYGV